MIVSLRLPGAAGRFQLRISADGRWSDAPGGDAELGEGWWALPGLADAHAHLGADDLDLSPGNPTEIVARAFACLDRGVFLVIDKGWRDDSVVATLSSLPPARRPDFQAAGRMIAVEGGYYPGFAVETDPAGLSAVVEQAAGEGQGWVKLVGDWPRRGRGALPNFDLAALTRAVEVAHAGGARVAIHTMAPGVASTAVAAGVDSIEHGLFLTESDLDQLAARRGAWVPTVLRMEAIADMLGHASSGGRLILDGLENVTRLLAAVPEDVVVLAGTDLATEPGEVGREAAALAKRGLAAERAVAAASSAAREYVGGSKAFGVGEPADAVFFDADPNEDPEVLARPVAVVRAGVRRS